MNLISNRLFSFGILFLAACFFAAPPARGGLTIDVHLYHNSDGYYFFPELSTNAMSPGFPTGVYRIASWQYPTNGAGQFYRATATDFVLGDGNGNYGSAFNYSDFGSFLYGITNGPWSLLITNSTSTNLYLFSVSITGLTSNGFGAAPLPVFPSDGATFVTNQPVFTWTGPANWAGTLKVEDDSVDASGNYYYIDSASLAPNSTTWMASTILPNGTNAFSVDYTSNAAALITATIPTNGAAQSIAGWISTATLESLFPNNFNNILFTVGAPSNGGGPVAHYDFDEGTVMTPDVSGNGNDMVYAGSFGGGSAPSISSDSITTDSIPPGSVSFDGSNYLTASSNLLSALQGSFSVSLWIKTTQNSVSDQGYFDAAGIVAADVPDYYGEFNDVIPVGMNQYGYVVFSTGNPSQGYDDEMYSAAIVNDGAWHHIVVTRDQTTGEKNIYIDGALDYSSPQYGTTNLLNAPVLLTIGALADASISDPTSPTYTGDNGYDGLVDDIQIYPRVLTPSEVAYLYDNPGTVVMGATNNVNIAFELDIVRNQDSTGGNEYYCFPYINSVSPTPLTTDEVQSPNNLFSCDQNGSSSSIEPSLGDVLNECTNGLWTLYINRNDPSEQQFTFTVSIAGVTTNLLKPVIILSPPNGSGDVSRLPSYDWTGPSGFDDVFVQLRHTNNVVTSDTLPGTATNWVYNSPLSPGTNTFYLNYSAANVTNITFSAPVDNNSTPVFRWTAQGGLDSEATSQFVVSSNAPVQLIGVQKNGVNLQFSFQTQSGLTNTIEVSTNLAGGVWTPLTNFTGDGSLRQFAFPTTNEPAEFFRVLTQ